MSFTKTASLLFLSLPFLLFSCGGDPEAARLSSDARAGDGQAQGLYNASLATDQAGNSGKAIKGYKKIIKDYPMSPVAAESQFRLAQLQQQEGDLTDAFDSYDTFLKNYPASPNYSKAIKQQEIIAHGVAEGQIKNSFLGLKSRLDSKRTAEMLGKVRDNAPRSLSAEKAQFAIGNVYKSRKRPDDAINAFRTLTRDYPLSSYAPEAQFQIGKLLLDAAEKGNQDSANLDEARNAFQDLLLRYPNSKRSGDAKREIAKIGSGEIQRSFDIAEFYRKKGQNNSAILYYKEVMRTAKPGPLRNQAAARIAELGG